MKSSRLRSIADLLTITRLFLGAPIIFFLSLNYLSIAWVLLLIGAFSDLLDGRLARQAGGGTTFGARIDPLADKIMIMAPFIWLCSKNILPTWAVWLLITRELLISAWRSEDNKGAPASLLGKFKTVVQFISLLLLIWPKSWGDFEIRNLINIIGLNLFWLSIILAFLSGHNYLRFKSNSYHS